MEQLASAAASVIPIWQAQTHHVESLRQANELHLKSLDQADTYHKEELKLAQMLHRRDCALEKELHYGEMSHDQDIARREGIRDVWSQRNQMMQTLMVVDTLMFACAFAIVVQADPPPSTPSWLIKLYATSLSLSLTFLFVSIWFSLKLQTRMSHYDMHRPEIVYSCGKTHLQFNAYYECHCRSLSTAAFGMFYCGTAAALSDAALFALSKLNWEYDNVGGGILFVVIAAFAMTMPLIGKWLWPTSAESLDYGGLGTDAAEANRQIAQARRAREEVLATERENTDE